MDTKDYENQKVIFLANTFAGGPNPIKVFSKEIKMSFMPTIMNVKSIHYFDNRSETKTRILQMDRIRIIGTFADSTTANNSNVSFKLGRTGWADGNYTFRVLESENDIDTEALAGRIVYVLSSCHKLYIFIYLMEKINNVRVRPVIQKGDGDKKAKGYKLFTEPYGNVFFLARKKSGKTTVAFEILRRCSSRKTRIVIIASTVFKDHIYKEMVKYLKNRGNPLAVYTHLKTDGMNVLEVELDKLNSPEEEMEGEVIDEEPEEKKEAKGLFFGKEENRDKPVKPRPSKYIEPEVIFVLDDLGVGLRDKTVSDLLKKNRHYKSKVIVSSQYLNDLKPESMKQLDYMWIFPGQSEDKLALVYKHLDLAMEFDYFMDKYHQATAKKYEFLYVDGVEDELRHNFDSRFL